jgi:23S rRNA (adenine2503-C2)-methyltransferase
MTVNTTTKKDIRELDKDALKELVVSLGEKAFRGAQIYEWLWKKGARSISDMTNISLGFREKLEEEYEIKPIRTDLVQKSNDGTIKSRFVLHDGFKIESVLIPVPDEERFTVCVSSQVGCSLTCKFCATGQMKRERNLTAGEIYDQVYEVNRQSLEHFGHPLTNIVFMGMGEPLLAYHPVMESIQKITSPEGMGMSPRRITVSTAGIAKMIMKMADEKVRFNLALSLHAADDVKRDEIMPINEQNNLAVLTEALQYFKRNTHPDNKVTFEYIAFQYFNDNLEDARNLIALSKKVQAHINIIEYNPVVGVDFLKSEEDRLNVFARALRDGGVEVTVRRSRGKDIDAACGQLANKE